MSIAPTTTGTGLTTVASRDLAQIGADATASPYARRGVSTSGETIRIILVDDHTIVRSAIKALLRSATDIVVVGEASSGFEAIALIARAGVDVVVMDLDMEGGGGAVATRILSREAPAVRVLILTMHTEQEQLVPRLNDGARACSRPRWFGGRGAPTRRRRATIR